VALFSAGVAVTLVLNFLLLGMTSERDDPVGRLTPVAVLSGAGSTPPPATSGGATSPGEVTTSTTTTEPAGTDVDDDHGDRGDGGAADEDD
jgi:hypothetical protein